MFMTSEYGECDIVQVRLDLPDPAELQPMVEGLNSEYSFALGKHNKDSRRYLMLFVGSRIGRDVW